MTAVEFIRQEFLEKITNENYKKSFDQIIEQAKEIEKEQMTIKKCYHPLTQRKYISDIHFECTICGFYDMVTQ